MTDLAMFQTQTLLQLMPDHEEQGGGGCWRVFEEGFGMGPRKSSDAGVLRGSEYAHGRVQEVGRGELRLSRRKTEGGGLLQTRAGVERGHPGDYRAWLVIPCVNTSPPRPRQPQRDVGHNSAYTSLFQNFNYLGAGAHAKFVLSVV